ncbi:MAG TPA: acyl-CoA dehydrogenase family protein [Candidatus Limnocylindria bacterium]|nr:acyl-CoA dehydrogenase family protein [Candidatus Limnocylindria bacterium]
MDLRFSPAEEAFRTELRAWLDANVPAERIEHATLADEVAYLRDWQQRLAEAGWVGIHWPREYGGRGATVIEHYLLQEELAAARAPEIVNRIGVNLVGPTLIAHGTDEQKRRFLPAIIPAREIWCQLFSEPGAGSDLTGLRTRAERRGDGWVVNGQKVWTSYAQFARWGILLARTDLEAPKAKGISFFICDMQAPGVTVRPLRQLTGSEEFNEVFLEDVFIPREHLVGAENQGWSIANTTLTYERGTSPRQLVIHRMLLQDLLRLARDGVGEQAPTRADPDVRQQLARHLIDVEIQKLNNWRTLTRIQRNLPLGPESSFVKLFWSEMSQRMHDTLMQMLGPRGLCWQPGPWAVEHGRLVRSYLYYRSATIFAGTSEIQRNILAERVLGLPRTR